MTTKTDTVKLRDIAYIFKHTTGNSITVKPNDIFITRTNITTEKPEKMLGVYIIRVFNSNVDKDYLRALLVHTFILPFSKHTLVNTELKIPTLTKQRKLVKLSRNIEKMRKLEKQKMQQLIKLEKAIFQNV